MGSAESVAHKLSGLSSSIISDVTGGHGVVSPGLIRFSGKGTVAGRAVTADCAEGSLQAVFAALDEAEPGAFLCIAGPGVSAYMGDLLATHLVRRGFVGAVVDGLIRDRATIGQLPASFFARGLTPVNLRRPDPGRPMVPVAIGGVTVNPGDWIVADDDGVVAIAPSEVEAVIAKAEASTRLEEAIMARIEAGARIPDAVREALAEAQNTGDNS